MHTKLKSKSNEKRSKENPRSHSIQFNEQNKELYVCNLQCVHLTSMAAAAASESLPALSCEHLLTTTNIK